MIFELNKIKLSHRIFGAMFMVIFFTAIFILIITLHSFRLQTQKYHQDSLNRKESVVIATIEDELDRYPEMATPENVYDILENKILGISNINKLDINIYDIRGNLLLTTQPDQVKFRTLPSNILDSITFRNDYIEIPVSKNNNITYFTSYSNVRNLRNEPVAIVNIPYNSNDSYFEDDMLSILRLFGGALFFILVAGGIISWVVANQITRRLKAIAYRLEKTEVVGYNKPIEYKRKDEISYLVDAYNEMLTKLNEQTALLTQTEREDAWREMAKQVAHEVKNPLTPMRLLIQNFARKFDRNDPEIEEKTKNLTNTLIHQIDTIASIAEAFSDFAKMPLRKDEKIDVAEEIKKAVDLFPENIVTVDKKCDECFYSIDRIYLNRIITNLVKNALQAIPYGREPKVSIIINKNKQYIILKVADNGEGVPPEIGNKIFEPKFTTKNGGTGLGLAMVKKLVEDYGGDIRYITELGEGTIFTVKFPL